MANPRDPDFTCRACGREAAELYGVASVVVVDRSRVQAMAEVVGYCAEHPNDVLPLWFEDLQTRGYVDWVPEGDEIPFPTLPADVAAAKAYFAEIAPDLDEMAIMGSRCSECGARVRPTGTLEGGHWACRNCGANGTFSSAAVPGSQ